MFVPRVLLACMVATAMEPTLAFAQAMDPSVLATIEALKPKPGKSRGIRMPVAPPDGPTAAAAPAPPTAVQKVATSSAPRVTAAAARSAPVAEDPRDRNVPFASGSAVVTPAAAKSLETLGIALKSPELQGLKFRIEGHTDTVGSPEANEALSAQRAQAVADYLSQTYGVSRDRFETVGKGEEGLLVATGPNVPEARNRRVHIETIGD